MTHADALDPDISRPENRTRRRVITALRLAVPVALLAALWSLADGPEVVRILRDVEWGWLFAAYVAANLQIVFSAFRWQLTARALDQTIPTGRAILEYYLSQLLNLTLPSGVLGDAGRAVRMRHQAGMIRASQAVLIERMAGQIALFVMLFLGFGLVSVIDPGMAMPDWLERAVLAVGLCLAGAILIFVVMRTVPGPLARMAQGFGNASLRALCSADMWPRQIAFSALTVTCNLAAIAFAAKATGTNLPLVAILTIGPLMLTAMLLPVSAGGWGLREATAAALWPLIGGTAAAGVAASVAFGLAIMAASLPGLIMLIGPARLRQPLRLAASVDPDLDPVNA
jgi:uncharacterized membrane protein YbhN (UPF0104 family)